MVPYVFIPSMNIIVMQSVLSSDVINYATLSIYDRVDIGDIAGAHCYVILQCYKSVTKIFMKISITIQTCRCYSKNINSCMIILD